MTQWTIRPARLAPLAVAACALAACVTTTTTTSGDGASATPAAQQAAPAPVAKADEKSDSGFARAGKIVATVPENVVWIPWKMIGTAFKGAGDGISAGYQKGNMPIVATVFAPVNFVFGFVNGFFEGMFMPPALIGPDDEFGKTMGLPTSRKTTVWWY